MGLDGSLPDRCGRAEASGPPRGGDRRPFFDDSEQAVELIEALRKLPPKQRAALVLHYYGGYRTREIAGILGSSAATVRVHLSAGRKRLRQLLETDDD